MDNYRKYLVGVGFDIPKQLPPLGVSDGLISAGGGGGAIYHFSLTIPKDELAHPGDVLREVYGFFLFQNLIPEPVRDQEEPVGGKEKQYAYSRITTEAALKASTSYINPIPQI